MRIDSHQHFWRYNPGDYPWIDERMRVLRRDFLPEHLRPLLEGLGFQKSIAVQARQSLAETEWLLKLAEENDFIAGVVGWVDLRSPELGQQLEKYARHPKLVGVRHVVQDEPDEYFVLLPDFIQGIARLGEFDLTYDLLVFPKQLPAAIKLVNQFPEPTFRSGSYRQTGNSGPHTLTVETRHGGVGEIPQCLLQALRHGDGSKMDGMASGRFLRLPRCRGRGIWDQSFDDWF